MESTVGGEHRRRGACATAQYLRQLINVNTRTKQHTRWVVPLLRFAFDVRLETRQAYCPYHGRKRAESHHNHDEGRYLKCEQWRWTFKEKEKTRRRPPQSITYIYAALGRTSATVRTQEARVRTFNVHRLASRPQLGLRGSVRPCVYLLRPVPDTQCLSVKRICLWT